MRWAISVNLVDELKMKGKTSKRSPPKNTPKKSGSDTQPEKEAIDKPGSSQRDD